MQKQETPTNRDCEKATITTQMKWEDMRMKGACLRFWKLLCEICSAILCMSIQKQILLCLMDITPQSGRVELSGFAFRWPQLQSLAPPGIALGFLLSEIPENCCQLVHLPQYCLYTKGLIQYKAA